MDVIVIKRSKHIDFCGNIMDKSKEQNLSWMHIYIGLERKAETNKQIGFCGNTIDKSKEYNTIDVLKFDIKY